MGIAKGARCGRSWRGAGTRPSGLFRYRDAVVVMAAAGVRPAVMQMAGRRRFEHVSGAAGKGERSNFDKDFSMEVRRLAAGVR
jgi:hypothetical protein